MSTFKITWTGFEALDNKLEKLAEAQTRLKAVCMLSAQDILNRGKEDGGMTPFRAGELRQSMAMSEIDDGAEVGYSAEYAPHVEYGHRQEVGRYVPAIGKRLVASYVEGQRYFQENVNEQGETFKQDITEQLEKM